MALGEGSARTKVTAGQTSSAGEPMRLVLFDIDGTLILSGGGGFRALTRAFKDVAGISNALEGVRLNGQTDPLIVSEALTQAGVADSPQIHSDIQSRYLVYLREEMPRSEKARLLPGVRPLLDRLGQLSDVTIGLLTGNIEPGARIKLDRFDLNRHFPFGAFGSDSAVRRELVPIAMARARQRCPGVDLGASDTIIVGDTERDVDCGRFAGARTLAVATGGVLPSVLRQAGADLVFDDFSPTDRIVDALMSLSSLQPESCIADVY